MAPGLIRRGRQAATLVVLAALAGCAGPAPSPTPRSGPLEFPQAIGSMAVHSVSEAQSLRERLDSDELLAVAGWLNLSEAEPCADPPAPFELEPSCAWDRLTLSEQAQDFATSLLAGVDWGPGLGPPADSFLLVVEASAAAIEQHLPESGIERYRSQQAVIIGHFHDARAGECSPESAQQCASAFVADRLAWLEGETLGPSVWLAPDPRTGQALRPQLDAERVQEAVGQAHGSGAKVVSMAAVAAGEIHRLEPRAVLAVEWSGIVWHVRFVAPADEPDAGGLTSGWLVLDDTSGQLLEVETIVRER